MSNSTPVAREELIHRRILGYFVRKDGTISSSAFKDSKKKPARVFCGDLARLSTARETQMRRGGAHFGVIKFLAGDAIDQGFSADHEPEMENEAHVTFRGVSSDDICSSLAEVSTIAIFPGQ